MKRSDSVMARCRVENQQYLCRLELENCLYGVAKGIYLLSGVKIKIHAIFSSTADEGLSIFLNWMLIHTIIRNFIKRAKGQVNGFLNKQFLKKKKKTNVEHIIFSIFN